MRNTSITQGGGPRRGSLLWGTALVVVLLFSLLNVGLRVMQERASDNPLFAVLVNDHRLLLDAATLEDFNADLMRLSAQQRQHADVYINAWIERWLHGSVALAQQAVPVYLDWYYSMPGSYSRLYHAIGGDLDGYLQQRMSQLLIEDSGLEARLGALERELQDEMDRVLAGQLEVVRRQLLGIYAGRQARPAEGKLVARTLDVDLALRLSLHPSEEDRLRWHLSSQASVVGGVGAFALVARRGLAPRLMNLSAVQGARRVLSGYALRLAPRIATAIGIGGSTAAVTSPSGPGALVAGSVAFVTAAGTLVITDFALLKAEEALLREDKQQQMEAELAVFREALVRQVQAQISTAGAVSQALIRDHLAVSADPAWQPGRFYIGGQTSSAPLD